VAGHTAAREAQKEVRSEQQTLAPGKLVAAAAGGFVSGFLGPAGGVGGAAGASVGAIYEVMNEFRGGAAKIADIQDPDRPPPAQFDHPPGVTEIGIVIHSVGVDPPAAPLDKRQVWPRFNKADPNDDRTLIMKDGAGRSYSLWVAAHSDDQDGRPVWLPSEVPSTPSFKGRWGNRAVSDPFNRRAGMRFPEFWAMFFEAIGM